MAILDDDIEIIDGYEELGKNVIDQAVVNNSQTLVPSGGKQLSVQLTVEPAATEYSIGEKYRSAFSATQSPEEFDAQVEMFRAELNAKQSMLLKFGTAENEKPLTGSALLNSIMSGSFSGNPDLAISFIDKVQYNFEINIEPTSIARVPSELNDWEIDNGFYLAPDDFGILRKFKNGIMALEDVDKVFVLQSAFENATKRAVAELLDSSSNVSPKIVNDSSIDVKTDSSYSPGLSDAARQGLGLTSSGAIVLGNSGNSAVNTLVANKPEVILVSNVSLNTKLGTQFSFTKFDRNKAVEYALKYANSPNLDYPNFGDNDCTNFVSQCWEYAGIPMSTVWFCTNIKKVYTNSWTDVEAFGNYMVKEGYCYISYSSEDAKIGDVIQFYNDKDGWHHSAIVTEIDKEGNIKYSGHSNPQNNRYLSDVYPQSGEQIRFLCVNRGLCDYAPDIPIA